MPYLSPHAKTSVEIMELRINYEIWIKYVQQQINVEKKM